jgi:hypothetical protein
LALRQRGAAVTVADARKPPIGNDSRDGRMKREFLENVKLPVVTFEPQKVSGYNPAADKQQISVAGVMTLHGAKAFSGIV